MQCGGTHIQVVALGTRQHQKGKDIHHQPGHCDPKHQPTQHVAGRDPLYSDIDIPVLDDINPIEIKINLLPKGLPIDRETTAKPFIHGYHNGYFSMGVMTGTHITFPSMSGGAQDADFCFGGRFCRHVSILSPRA